MATGRSGLDRTLGELKRRHVIRVLGAYAVSAWVVLQVADIVLPALLAPEWIMTALVAAAIGGAPVAAGLAWIYDLTPQGIRRTPATDTAAPATILAGTRWIDYVIIAALLVILAFALVRPGATGRIGNSVAVLPFSELGAESGQRGYLGDGVAEAIMDALARIRGIRVSARTSSFSLRNSGLGAREIAQRLGVETLLEGSVRRAGSELRVSARLVDGRTGTQVWSRMFTGNLDDAFQLQAQVAAAVARVMEVRGEPDSRPDLATRNPQAYDLYLRGRAKLRSRSSPEGIDEAAAHFRKALALDPDFGSAAAGLCQASWARYESSREPATAEKAMTTCRETQARYPDLVETRIAIGSLLLGTGKPGDAEAMFRSALEDEPNSADARLGLGLALADQGTPDRARAEIARAIDLDPANWEYHWHLGVLQIMDGALDPAIAALKNAIGMNPASPNPYNSLGGAYFLRGEFLLAADAFEQSIQREPNPVAYSNAGTNYFFAREFTRAEAMFRRATELAPDDFRYSGFLAWAIRAREDDPTEAERLHRTTITNATRRLAINVNDHEARAALAVHLAALGLDVAAGAALASLPEARELNINALSMTGFAHYYLGQFEHSADLFARALDAGLPEFVLTRDPRLRDAWRRREFEALLDARLTAHANPTGENQ